MTLNILVILKTLLYIDMTNISHNRILVLAITSLITIGWLSFLDKLGPKYGPRLRAVFYSLFSLIIFGDTLYFLQFNMLPSVKLVGQLGLLASVTDAVWEIVSPKNLLLLVDLPFILVYSWRQRESRSLKIRPAYPLGILGLVLGLTFFTGKFQEIRGQELYSYHILDIVEAGESGASNYLTEENIRALEENTRFKEGRFTGLGQGKNLIVIQVEALQNFVIGLDYRGQEITPNLNRLIGDQSSLYYDRYYQLVGRGNTADAEFVSNNSLHPAMDAPSYTRYEENTFYGLPVLLRDYGYRTLAMHGYKKDFWNRDRAYRQQGFDEFLHQDFYQGGQTIGMGVSDRDFFKKNIDYLKDQVRENPEEAFYAFMVTLTSHTPFKMGEEFYKIEMDSQYRGSMLENYIQSIHYLDEQIGFFMEELRASGLYDNTVVAIYGDHFAIKASDQDEARLMAELLGRSYDYDQMMNIPLIIHVPGEDLGQKISKVGSQIDFYPTILNIMGYENKKGLVFGRDLNNYQGENLVKPQTYMTKGSFIKEDLALEISRDGVFEHSRAFAIEDGRQVSLAGLRDYYNKVLEEINLSDYIARNNLLKDYMETGRLEVARAGSNIRALEDLGPGSLEDAGGQTGLRVEVTEDGRIQNSDLGLEDLVAYSQDFDFILSGSRETLEAIYEDYDLKNFIVELRDVEDYIGLTNNKYERLAFNPYEKNYSRRLIKDFIEKYPDSSLILRERDIKKFKDSSITIYRQE